MLEGVSPIARVRMGAAEQSLVSPLSFTSVSSIQDTPGTLMKYLYPKMCHLSVPSLPRLWF